MVRDYSGLNFAFDFFLSYTQRQSLLLHQFFTVDLRRTSMSRQFFAALFAAGVGLILAVAPVAAHHSFAAEFDGKKPVKVTGIVKKVEWTNPHVWFYVEGKDAVSGRSGVWGFSAGAPGLLSRKGIPRDAMKPGDTVIVEGFVAKDGSLNASGGKVTFSDGRSVFTAGAEDDVPK
jgi:hypothetical protein